MGIANSFRGTNGPKVGQAAGHIVPAPPKPVAPSQGFWQSGSCPTYSYFVWNSFMLFVILLIFFAFVIFFKYFFTVFRSGKFLRANPLHA